MSDSKVEVATFDTVAEIYDKMRPGYVKELYEHIFSYSEISASSNVLEVGIGSGQATLPILQTGCKVTAVEYGKNFSDICHKKFMQYPTFSVITGKFEETELLEESYDCIYSATAFHWIPEELGYSKVIKLLKPGGTFARFANRPSPDCIQKELQEDIERLYEQYYYPYHPEKKRPMPGGFTCEQAVEIANIPQKYGFTDTCYEIFHRKRCFSPKEYTALLGTYSDHIVIEAPIRQEFFERIEEAILHYGENIILHDILDLELARKPL